MKLFVTNRAEFKHQQLPADWTGGGQHLFLNLQIDVRLQMGINLPQEKGTASALVSGDWNLKDPKRHKSESTAAFIVLSRGQIPFKV